MPTLIGAGDCVGCAGMTTAVPAGPATRAADPRLRLVAPWTLVRRHLAGAAVLTVVVAVAPIVLHHRNAPSRLHVVADGILGGWLRWDGWWYLMIAAHGYRYQPHRM